MDKKVISLPDVSPNRSLYLMNRAGWTSYNMHEKVNHYTIDDMIKLGASALILSDSTYMQKEGIREHTRKLLGRYGDIMVFDLQK